MARTLSLLILLLFLLQASAQTAGDPWYSTTADGVVSVDLYFFWSQSCPHCQEARPHIERLVTELPWVRLHDLEVSRQPEHARLYRDMATALGQEARSVPAFLFCGVMVVGFDVEGEVGGGLSRQLQTCRDSLADGQGFGVVQEDVAAGLMLRQAGLGGLDLRGWSLPMVTVVIAGLDAFNPCAFFVLLFLLSLLVHAGGRARMLLVGGVFVSISGLVYFALMAAWLNVFLVAGQLPLVTSIAGALAVVMALLNLKDAFWPGRGPTLAIADGAKPGLYQRVRALLRADNLATMLLGTVVLAVVANSYELLCTAGFPMLYTRLLTLEQLPSLSYYLYLVLYNLIYVLPLFVIVTVFTVTLGAHKLQAEEGKLLKLLSGTMMLGLGGVLLLAPALLSDVRVALGILLAALGLTFITWRWQRRAR